MQSVVTPVCAMLESHHWFHPLEPLLLVSRLTILISKSATRIFTAKVRVVCISKLATRIFTAKIQVVCISKFATRIFTAKIRVVGVSEFATRILTAKIRVVSISKFATRIFTAKVRVVCASKFATRIFPAKILVVCVSKCATDSNSYRKNPSESYCRKKSVDFRRKIWRSVNFKFATQIFTAKVQRRCNFKIYNLDFYV